MARILVTETIAPSGLDRLRQAGHTIDEQIGLSPDELLTAVKGAEALIIRSATQVTDEVLAAGTELLIVGRAGAGVDNVDIEAATRRGIMVANAPGTNSLSTAEHAMAMLLSLARNVPQSHAALVAGRWEKSKWEGVELHGKTLGILGLGRIGTLVAQRGHAFGMQLVAWDLVDQTERARRLGIEMLELDELMARADFVSIHLLRTKESVGLIGAELLARAKPGIRIINGSRGGLVDEDALADAIESGHVGGAALDVFATEPTTDSPLFGLPQVVVTPHLGASTPEAQDKAGAVVADQVALALAGEFVPFAVNVSAAEVSDSAQAFLPLAERLGEMFAALAKELPADVAVEYHGDIAGEDTRILTLSVLRGLFGSASAEPVTFVNAPTIAKERGVEVTEVKVPASEDFVNLVVIRGGDHAIGGTLVGLRSEPRIVMLDDHALDLPPASNMLVVRNEDRPRMIAAVTSALGDAGINIDDMHLGRSAAGAAALMVLATSPAVPPELRDQLRAIDGIESVHVISR